MARAAKQDDLIPRDWTKRVLKVSNLFVPQRSDWFHQHRPPRRQVSSGCPDDQNPGRHNHRRSGIRRRQAEQQADSAAREQWFVEHPAGIREITAVTLTTPVSFPSTVSERMISNGILSTRPGTEYLLEIEFDGGGRNKSVDFRPRLPLVFRL
jgi:hypothetical protein